MAKLTLREAVNLTKLKVKLLHDALKRGDRPWRIKLRIDEILRDLNNVRK